MSGDEVDGSDLPCAVVDNVSYSPTHVYKLPIANSTIANQGRPLPKEKLCSATSCHTEHIKNEYPLKLKVYGIILISGAIFFFIAVGIAFIVGVAKLHAVFPLLQSTDDRLTASAELLPSIHDRLTGSIELFQSIHDRLTGSIELLQSLVDRLTDREELPASNLTKLGVAHCLENISDSLSSHLTSLISKTTGNTTILAAILIDVVNETGYSFDSCAAIQQCSPSSPSGNYHIVSSNGSAVNGSAVRVYCDMTLSCGNITGGWMRVAELDMRDTTTQCPDSLKLRNGRHRTCRIRSSDLALCSSETFTVNGVGYSKVCGRIRAYQVGSTDAFGLRFVHDIETYYVDGVSLTHGTSPRQHIWTFASANSEDSIPSFICPCINTATSSLAQTPPTFVGEDYFCDTGAIISTVYKFYAADPLWEGDGCGPLNTCCSFNTPPWFYKQLPQLTTDDIEMRVCRDEERANEDIAIEVVEIYVQ